jgi:hypothetical protein
MSLIHPARSGTTLGMDSSITARACSGLRAGPPPAGGRSTTQLANSAAQPQTHSRVMNELRVTLRFWRRGGKSCHILRGPPVVAGYAISKRYQLVIKPLASQIGADAGHGTLAFCID